MSGPHIVAAIGFSSIIALAAILSTSVTVMDNSLAAQEAMKAQTQRHREDLEMTISDGVMIMRNKGFEPVVVKELRVYSDIDSALLSRSEPGENISKVAPLARVTYTPEALHVQDFLSKTVSAITDLGNVFTAENTDGLASGSGTAGRSVIDGMGINSRIIQQHHEGRIVYGYGAVGQTSSLKPYNSVPTDSDFAAQILSADGRVVMPIPKFRSEYRYLSGQQALQQTDSAPPNVLSYLQSRAVGGSGSAAQGPNGITFSGTGTVIVKLSDFGGQTVILEGSVPAGAELRLGEFDKNDLMTIPYNSALGWNVWSATYGSIHAGHYHTGCGAPYSAPHTLSLQPRKEVSPQYGVKRLVGSTYYSPTFTTSATGGQLKIETISETTSVGYCNWGLICGDSSCTWGWNEYNYPNTTPPHIPIPGTVSIFDQNPPNTVHVTFTSSYQLAHTFPSGKQMYLVAKPNGNAFTVKATAFDVQTTPYLKITDLPPNTPYEITKDGLVSASGMALPDGTLTLLLGDVNIGGSHPSGTITIYPDSLKHRGQFSTVVFDNINGAVFHAGGADSSIYVAHAYVQIPVTGNATITGVSLDGVLALPHIDGNYTTGYRVRIPIVPGYHNISMGINGVPVAIAIADVLGGTGLKVVEPGTSTTTRLDDDGLVSSISATTGSTSYVVATTQGRITTVVTATVSGTSHIENRAYFGSPPPQPPPPPPSDPLKAYVDTYKNGRFVSQNQIYFNSDPLTSTSGRTEGSSSSVSAQYSYPQTVISGTLTTDVAPGDMVEFYLYAEISSDGPVPPIPPNHIFYNYAGTGRATATIHGGSILSS